MSVAVWNCHSWPVDVISSVKLPFSMWGGPSAKVGSSAKLCVPVFKASLLDYWGIHLTKCVCLPSVVYWHSRHLCCIQGAPLAKVGSSAKCCVLVFKASMLYLFGGSIGQRRFVCQVLVLLVGGGSIGQRRFICQVLVSLVGGPSAKEGSSAKYWSH